MTTHFASRIASHGGVPSPGGGRSLGGRLGPFIPAGGQSMFPTEGGGEGVTAVGDLPTRDVGEVWSNPHPIHQTTGQGRDSVGAGREVLT